MVQLTNSGSIVLRLAWLTEGEGGRLTLVRRRTTGKRQETSNKSAMHFEQAMSAASATLRMKLGALPLSDALRSHRRSLGSARVETIVAICARSGSIGENTRETPGFDRPNLTTATRLFLPKLPKLPKNFAYFRGVRFHIEFVKIAFCEKCTAPDSKSP